MKLLCLKLFDKVSNPLTRLPWTPSSGPLLYFTLLYIVLLSETMSHIAPKYLTDCYTPVSDIASRRHLRSVSRRHLSVPCYWLSTFSRRAFSVAGPTVWNSLPDSLRDPARSSSSFTQLLKMDFFSCYSAHSVQ